MLYINIELISTANRQTTDAGPCQRFFIIHCLHHCDKCVERGEIHVGRYRVAENCIAVWIGVPSKVVDKLLHTRLVEENLKQKQSLYSSPNNYEAMVPTRVNSEIWQQLKRHTRSEYPDA